MASEMMSRGGLDDLIRRLVDARRRWNEQVAEGEIRQLCAAAKEVLMRQPNLLELNAPINICGDVHGQYGDLLRILDRGGFPPRSRYLFLGDYVDRGDRSIETVCLLMALMVRHPNNVFLLRGNHECASVNRIYGFYDECKRRYSVRLWRLFTDCFNWLPVAALVDDRIFCVHGGISPQLRTLDQIRALPRPTDDCLCDLLWADPSTNNERLGWAANQERGVSFTFGADVVSDFLRRHDLDLLCRAHQVVEDGYQFFADRRLVTVFSAPNYCGEFDNDAAIMAIDANLVCSFQIIKPADKTTSNRFFSSSSSSSTSSLGYNNNGRRKGLLMRYC
ncbi:hypothetical protein EJB05_03694, partial [Eragrostis curvula]